MNRDHGRCVKSINFKKHGGRLNVERKLKFRCLAGRDLTTTGAHSSMPFPEPVPSLGSLDTLDSVRDMLQQSGADGVSASPAKRPRRS